MKLKALDIDQLTIEEVEAIEDYTGMSLEQWQKTMQRYDEQGEMPPFKMLTPVIWLSGKAENPRFTMDDARKVRVSELESADENPTASTASNGTTGGKGKSKKAATGS